MLWYMVGVPFIILYFDTSRSHDFEQGTSWTHTTKVRRRRIGGGGNAIPLTGHGGL
jgi:hypothetical protein